MSYSTEWTRDRACLPLRVPVQRTWCPGAKPAAATFESGKVLEVRVAVAAAVLLCCGSVAEKARFSAGGVTRKRP